MRHNAGSFRFSESIRCCTKIEWKSVIDAIKPDLFNVIIIYVSSAKSAISNINENLKAIK